MIVPRLRFVTEDQKTGNRRPLTPPTSQKRGALFTDASQPVQRRNIRSKTDSESFPSSMQDW